MNIILTSNSALVAQELLTAGEAVAKEATKIASNHAQLLRTKIMARASGRPGPNAPTGDYRRSWGVQSQKYDGLSIFYVGTNAPQGRRLEFGFTGVDSLGRVYDQPPYPHVEPAVAEVSPMFTAKLEELVRKL